MNCVHKKKLLNSELYSIPTIVNGISTNLLKCFKISQSLPLAKLCRGKDVKLADTLQVTIGIISIELMKQVLLLLSYVSIDN